MFRVVVQTVVHRGGGSFRPITGPAPHPSFAPPLDQGGMTLVRLAHHHLPSPSFFFFFFCVFIEFGCSPCHTSLHSCWGFLGCGFLLAIHPGINAAALVQQPGVSAFWCRRSFRFVSFRTQNCTLPSSCSSAHPSVPPFDTVALPPPPRCPPLPF